jgi:hypothetical protein
MNLTVEDQVAPKLAMGGVGVLLDAFNVELGNSCQRFDCSLSHADLLVSEKLD